jgi:hypothetical protein
VAWHPTRAFLAVATSDGLVDVWGPRINWTAFAPDFQALPRNIEYVEREDEFDQVVVVDNIDSNNNKKSNNNAENEMDVERDEEDDETKPTSDPDAATISAAAIATTMPMDVDDTTASRDASAAATAVATDDSNDKTTITITTTSHHHHAEEEANEEDAIVDVQTIKPVPVFASDSEDETQVFSFETRLKNIILMRLGKGIRQVNKEDD